VEQASREIVERVRDKMGKQECQGRICKWSVESRILEKLRRMPKELGRKLVKLMKQNLEENVRRMSVRKLRSKSYKLP
jgi:hypothetical protein